MEHTAPPKRTLEIECIYKCIKSALKRFGWHRSRKEAGEGRANRVLHRRLQIRVQTILRRGSTCSEEGEV